MTTIQLTRMEQSALTSILIDHMRQPDSTLEWFDVIGQETVTIDDLLTKITTADDYDPGGQNKPDGEQSMHAG